MKKSIVILLTILICFLCANNFTFNTLFASPQNAINQADLAQKLLIKLQQNNSFDEEIEKQYRYLDILCQENTQFYSYNIKEIETLMNIYRENIITYARTLARDEKFKQAVELLESKSEIFKDKSTINSLINHYSKFYIKEGLEFCEIEPKILAINKLIAYPQLAFQNNSNSEFLDENYLTNKEFLNLLNELYLNNFILINIYDYIDISNNTPLIQDLYLPPNKKPLILLFNNINYFEDEPYFIDKLIIDSNNKIATYSSKQNEQNQISYTSDFLPILENFIEENKSFSFNNAKGIISISNNGNILGYNMNKNNPNFNNDLINLKNIITNLKDNGYNFAFGNFDKNLYELNIEQETKFINETLLNIFPNTNIFISSKNKNSPNKIYNTLNNCGFKIFIDKSNNNLSIKNNLIFLSYFEINGNILRQKKDYWGLNFEKIYDHNNRTKIF